MIATIITSPWPVHSLHVTPGDILVVQVPEGTSEETMYHCIGNIRDALEEACPDAKFQILLVSGALHVDMLTEDWMREWGWERTKPPS